MTNGGDRHHGQSGKKKAASAKPKPKDPQAVLKRKNMLPKGFAATKGK